MSKVAVIGLGYTGLPVMAVAASQGHQVIGIEKSGARIEEIIQNDFDEPGLRELLGQNWYKIRQDIEEAHDCDIVIVCVDVPLYGPYFSGPDFSGLASVLDNLKIRDSAVLIIESTLPLYGMAGIVLPKFPYAVNCPERLSSGTVIEDIKHMARVIGCQGKEQAEKAREFYSTITDGELVITDCATAEMTKLVENADRNLHIAFANELARQCYDNCVDFWEVRDIVNRQRKRQILTPGISIGGHCLEKDLIFLAEHNAFLQDVSMANKLAHFSAYNQIMDFCGSVPEKVLILGYTYRENTKDTRNSPTQRLASILEYSGVEVAIYDPYVPEYNSNILFFAKDTDLIILAVSHECFLSLDYDLIGQWMKTKRLFDCKGLFNGRFLKALGYKYGKLGDGKN